MPTVALVTASAASLPPNIITTHNIHLVPFTIQFAHGNLRDSTDTALDEFYQRLVTDSVVPTTAPTSPPQFIQSLERIEADVIVVYHISSRISQSYHNGVLAAQRLPNRQIINIDTGSVGLGTGLQVLVAAQALAAGVPLDDVLAQSRAAAHHTILMTAPESVRFLRLSGRLGRIPAMAASLFGIVPLLGVDDEGEISLLERTRSQTAAVESMLAHLKNFIGRQRVAALGVSHTNDLAKAEALRDQLQSEFPDTEILISDAGPILAVHVGPGAVAVAAMRVP